MSLSAKFSASDNAAAGRAGDADASALRLGLGFECGGGLGSVRRRSRLGESSAAGATKPIRSRRDADPPAVEPASVEASLASDALRTQDLLL